MTYFYQKDIDSQKIKSEMAAVGLPAPTAINTVNTTVEFVFTNALSSGQEVLLQDVVTAHIKQTTAEGLSIYLASQVFPFVQGLIAAFAAENISMGITQAGKTGHVLALFSKKYPIPNADFQNCLKDSFDTGSLYVSLDIIQHIRNNPSEYSGLGPFITDARLLGMKNKIEAFLGVPLST